MKDQTDTELIKLIAEKVMGWEFFDEPALYGGSSKQGWYKGEEKVKCTANGWSFHPLTSDADCMMAWDEFVLNQMSHKLFIEVVDIKADIAFIMMASTGADRRRAMCECMAQSVAKAVS